MPRLQRSGLRLQRNDLPQNRKQLWALLALPVANHPGTPRLFEGGKFLSCGRQSARFNALEYRPPAEDIDAEYPLILTTGRVVSQFLSGTQTRRIGPLVQQYPEPLWSCIRCWRENMGSSMATRFVFGAAAGP